MSLDIRPVTPIAGSLIIPRTDLRYTRKDLSSDTICSGHFPILKDGTVVQLVEFHIVGNPGVPHLMPETFRRVNYEDWIELVRHIKAKIEAAHHDKRTSVNWETVVKRRDGRAVCVKDARGVKRSLVCAGDIKRIDIQKRASQMVMKDAEKGTAVTWYPFLYECAYTCSSVPM